MESFDSNNKASKVHSIGTSRLIFFYDCEFLIQNVRYILKLKKKMLLVSMLDDIGYCTRIERGVLKILYGSLIMSKGFKMCGS